MQAACEVLSGEASDRSREAGRAGEGRRQAKARFQPRPEEPQGHAEAPATPGSPLTTQDRSGCIPFLFTKFERSLCYVQPKLF